MAKEIDIQVQEAQRVPNKLDPKRTPPRHIIIKIPKVKDRESEKQRVTYKGVPIRLSADLVRQAPTYQKKLCRQEGNGKMYSK